MENTAKINTPLVDELAQLRCQIAELEDALQRTKTGLAEAQSIAHIGSWTIDLLSGEMTWSKEIYRIFGIDPNKVSPAYLACAETAHPDDIEFTDMAYTESVMDKTPYDIVRRLLLKDGTIRYVHERGKTFYDEKGDPLRSVGTVQDITERKVAEQALFESEHRFRAIFDSAGDGILIVDGKSRHILDGNLAITRLLGYTMDELRTLTVKDIHREEDWCANKEKFELIASGQSVGTFELAFKKKDGSVLYTELTGVPLVIQGKSCVCGIIRDITARKNDEQSLFKAHDDLEQEVQGRTAELRREISQRIRTEQALRQSERRFRAMFEQAAVGVAQIESKSGKFMRVNRRYCEIVGYTQEEMKSRSFQDITYPDDLAEDLENMRQLLEGAIRDFTMEKRYVCKDGLLVWVNLTVSPMWTAGEEPNYHIAVVEDITKRKRAEFERLAHERRQRDTLIREVHHRIKNNLQGVVGLLGQQAKQHPEIAEHLNEALSQLESVALVFGLRSQEAGGAIVLSAMVEAIANSVQCYVQLPIELSETPKRHPPARIDTDEAVALALAINELLINAAKHHTAENNKGTIKITQLYHAGRVELSIINQGGLLPKFDFEHGRGLGTGLALVKSMLPRKGAKLCITGNGDLVIAQLNLGSPLVQNVGDGWLDQG